MDRRKISPEVRERLRGLGRPDRAIARERANEVLRGVRERMNVAGSPARSRDQARTMVRTFMEERGDR